MISDISASKGSMRASSISRSGRANHRTSDLDKTRRALEVIDALSSDTFFCIIPLTDTDRLAPFSCIPNQHSPAPPALPENNERFNPSPVTDEIGKCHAPRHGSMFELLQISGIAASIFVAATAIYFFASSGLYNSSSLLIFLKFLHRISRTSPETSTMWRRMVSVHMPRNSNPRPAPL